jgi:hypothetical protein
MFCLIFLCFSKKNNTFGRLIFNLISNGKTSDNYIP